MLSDIVDWQIDFFLTSTVIGFANVRLLWKRGNANPTPKPTIYCAVSVYCTVAGGQHIITAFQPIDYSNMIISLYVVNKWHQ
ncbi:hypothetical protein V1521DRAFT_431980 [Lipomyces starkeyi]